MPHDHRNQSPGNAPAMKPGIDLHVSASACTPIPDWQEREDHLDTHSFHLGPQRSEVLLDLAQVLLYHVTVARMEKKQGIVVSF